MIDFIVYIGSCIGFWFGLSVLSVMNGLYEIFREWKNHSNEENTIFSVSALLDRIDSQEKIIKRLRHKMILLEARVSHRLST